MAPLLVIGIREKARMTSAVDQKTYWGLGTEGSNPLPSSGELGVSEHLGQLGSAIRPAPASTTPDEFRG
jgi:hypothetical protein